MDILNTHSAIWISVQLTILYDYNSEGYDAILNYDLCIDIYFVLYIINQWSIQKINKFISLPNFQILSSLEHDVYIYVPYISTFTWLKNKTKPKKRMYSLLL